MNDDITNSIEITALQQELDVGRELINQLHRKHATQTALNEILHISLLSIPFEEQLEKILTHLLDIDWLSIEKKAAIFSVDESQKKLRMVAQKNLADSLLSTCHEVPFGNCLCGKVAANHQIIFKSCLDEDHEYLPEGIVDHGHYVLPVIYGEKLRGVLNLYVKHGHRRTDDEEAFLHACSDVIAGTMERKIMQDQLLHLTRHDELTELPNRRYLLEHLERTANLADRNKSKFAVLFIDLDGFKAVNDNYGHQYGDKVLQTQAARIKHEVRGSDFISRIGGDEFIVVMENATDKESAVFTAEKIIARLSRPIPIDSVNISVGASIGISLYPEHAGKNSCLDRLIQKADQALYGAKLQRGRAVIFNQ